MGRYFSEHYIDSHPVPVDEGTALERGSYLLEVASPDGPRHLRQVCGGELVRIIYRDAQPSPAILTYQQRAYAGIPSEITTPITRDGDSKRWTAWTYGGDGVLERRSEYVQEPRRTTDTWFHGDGTRGGMLERLYDEHGDEVRVLEHAPDGRVLVHD